MQRLLVQILFVFFYPRFFPGKVDIWFHSHQIFHCFVIAGAFVHYHGISLMAMYRLRQGECEGKNHFSVFFTFVFQSMN